MQMSEQIHTSRDRCCALRRARHWPEAATFCRGGLEPRGHSVRLSLHPRHARARQAAAEDRGFFWQLTQQSHRASAGASIRACAAHSNFEIYAEVPTLGFHRHYQPILSPATTFRSHHGKYQQRMSR